jgi:hypothetical protein
MKKANYDELLASMVERSAARTRVRDAVTQVLKLWEQGD